MKITFLGSSHGVPSAERFCSCTMLEVENSIYLIDAGAPVVDMLMRHGKSVEDLRAVFTTHSHSDHTKGLVGLTCLCNWYFKKASFDVFVTNEDIPAVVSAYIAATDGGKLDEDRLRSRLACEGDIYKDENIKITYIPTKHCEPAQSYAILVEAEGKRILFSGDLSSGLKKEDLPKIAIETPTDLIVCEMAHFGLEHIQPYMKQLQTAHLCFNHVYPLGKLEAINTLSESGEYNYRISAASDGDSIEF